ncbi:folate family ECF transporter S component [Lacticaseibacillus brantae]|uniref:folate family ECF transporter S component n=1 Tax=Lacticaseibacillus brantae TaxID=943673 RepID=UPI00070E1584|nr:folate family ECF transporter S component [Lacticaseibacillus brantae]
MESLSFSSSKLSVKNTVIMGLLVAMNIVLGRFSVGPSFAKISLVFFATILMGYLLGPWWAAVGAAIADQLGILLTGGQNFPGFTISAAIAAMIYGMFFYRQKITWWRAIVAVFLVMLISNVILTTWWLDIMGTPWQGIIVVRAVKNLVVFPFQAVLTYFTLKEVERLKPQLHLDD